MIDPQTPHDQLLTLLAAVCDGHADDAERRRLDVLLAADSAARSAYLRYMALHAALERRRPELPKSLPSQPTMLVGPEHRSWRIFGSAAAAALVLLTVAVWFVMQSTSQDDAVDHRPAAPVAMLSNISSDAQFAEGGRLLGDDLQPGVITLTSGQAQVMFHSGAVVDLTGPCEFKMTGMNQGFLLRGKLEATVPPRAKNFTVGAPYGIHVIDLGTRFSMNTDEDVTRVRVLEGRVELAMTQNASTPQRLTLDAGHLARLQRGRLVEHLGPERELALTPDADTYINGRVPDQSLGNDPRLIANEWNASGPRWTMIRFDLTHATDPITTARLELTSRLVNAQPNTFAVYGLNTDAPWVETGAGALTYANTPWRTDSGPNLDAMFNAAPLSMFTSTQRVDEIAVAFDVADDDSLMTFLNQHRGGRVTFVIAEHEPLPDAIGDAWDSRESNHPPRLMLHMAPQNDTSPGLSPAPVKGREK